MAKNLLNQIKVLRPKIIKLPEGNIMHFLKKKDLRKNQKFGEVYFSKIKLIRQPIILIKYYLGYKVITYLQLQVAIQ